MTLEAWGWGLATVKEDLKSNRNDDVNIEKLGLNGGAKANGSIQVY